MKTYTANQPLLFPHIYMMNRYAQVDAYVAMNNAQFTKFGHQSRVELMDKHGKEVLLIVPLKNRSFKLLNEVEMSNPLRTVGLMIKTLQMLYGALPNYRKHKDALEHAMWNAAYNSDLTLAYFNEMLMTWVFDVAGINVQRYASEVIVPVRDDHPSVWVAQMGAAINCTEYLGGKVAQEAYLRESDFAERGMTFKAQDFTMKPYRRGKGMNSKATVSFLDPLFYLGVDGLRELIEA